MPDAYADARAKLSEGLASTRLGRAWAERRVTTEQARRLVMRLVRSARRDFRGVTSSLVAGSISPGRWYRAMARGVAAVHTAAGMIAAGTARPIETIRAAIDATVQRQLGFLNRWYRQLKTVAAPLDGRAVNRAGQYANSAWGSAQTVWRLKAMAAGYQWERRRLGLVEKHCPDCLDYAAMGWQPVGTLPPIGDSLCRSNCDCRFEYMMEEPPGTAPPAVPPPTPPPVTPPSPAVAPPETPVPAQPGLFRRATTAIGGFVGRFLKRSRSTLFAPAGGPQAAGQIEAPAPVTPTLRDPQAIQDYLKRQLDRLAASRAATGFAEQAFAAEYGKALEDYAKNAANTPGLVPPGPIRERIEVYMRAYGNEKLDAIASAFGKVESGLKASIEYMESRKNAIVADLAGGRPMSEAERAALQAEAKSLVLAIGEVANSQRPALRQAIVDLLRVENPTRIRTEEIAGQKLDEKAIAQHSRAKRFLSPILHDNGESANTVKLGQVSKRAQQRAYYDDKKNTIMAPATDMAATHVHELGHWIDEQVKLGGQNVLTRSLEFLRARTAGEQAVSINQYTGSNSYKSNEAGKPDKFDEIFGERAAYVGKDYAGTGSEIISMGLEILHNAAEHFVKDREFAGFVLGILDGKLR